MRGQQRSPRLLDQATETLQGSRFLSLLAGGVCALLALLLVAGVRAYGDLQHAKAREAELEKLVSEADLRVSALESRIERLQHDDAALERVAREELGMLFPDEFVVLLPDDGQVTGAAAGGAAEPVPPAR